MSFEDWPEVRLSDLVDIKHGFAFAGQYFRDEPSTDVLLTPGNFAIGGGFKDDKLKFYEGPVPEDFVLSTGDLLITMTDLSKEAGTLGYPAFVPDSPRHRYLHNQRLGRVTARDEASVDLRYLFYILCSPAYRQEVLAGATGTTVKHTSPARIGQFRFRLPPLAEQRRIARALGAVDDKIELNRSMNRTLESIAQAIFKSWFVDFEPVRKKVEGSKVGLPANLASMFPDKLCESETGERPAGWTVGCLGDLAIQARDSVNPDDLPAGTPYFGLEHLPRRSVALSDWGYAEEVSSGKSRFVVGDVLFGKLRPYFHKVGPPPVNGVCSTDVVVVRSRSHSQFAFVLGHLSSSEFVDYANATASGTRMPRTSWKDMSAYRLAIPPAEVLRAFGSVVDPLIGRIHANIMESRPLRELRDGLLPRLLGGELKMSAVEARA